MFFKKWKIILQKQCDVDSGGGGVIHVNVICPLELRNEGNDYPLKIWNQS